MKDITIYDLARELKLSAATVSRALKGHPKINKQTKKRILDKAAEMGYRSNMFASSLRSKKTNTLGVIVPRINSYFMATVLAGMEDAANRKGYNLIITNSHESAAKEKASATILFNKRVDGLLVSLATGTEDCSHLEPFLKKNIPIIFFDRTIELENTISIIIDNYKAAYEATAHLISQGCKRIMHITGSLARNVYSERLRGYKQALKDNKLSVQEKFIYISSFNDTTGKEAADMILKFKAAERPDGVFVANDSAAVHCMLHLKAANIAIPQEIAFVGFNNDPISKIIEPNLTTVSYPAYAMGEIAVTNLINILNKESNAQATNSLVMRSELLIRASSLKTPLP